MSITSTVTSTDGDLPPTPSVFSPVLPNRYEKQPNELKPGESRLWCHTAGRISCFARIPLYGIATIFTLAKMPFKFVWSTVQLLVNILFIAPGKACINLFKDIPIKQKIEGSNSWSFTGLLRDSIALANVAQRTLNSIWLTIVAPPSNYRDFQKAASVCKSTMLGDYHALKKTEGSEDSNPTPVREVFEGLIAPNYFRQISPVLIPSSLKTHVTKMGPHFNG